MTERKRIDGETRSGRKVRWQRRKTNSKRD